VSTQLQLTITFNVKIEWSILKVPDDAILHSALLELLDFVHHPIFKQNISGIETIPIITSKCGRYILRSDQLKKLCSISD
jgi:hypothetical protein